MMLLKLMEFPVYNLVFYRQRCFIKKLNALIVCKRKTLNTTREDFPHLPMIPSIAEILHLD